ncbi:MAG: hypothetical protein JNL98_05770 [Bryobacterales bacterium]|nr:hypothetical protein [Bryobacterales bacterium]
MAALKKACDDAYDKNLNSCSNAVWDVIRVIVNPNETYRVANALMDHMASNWKAVTVEEGFTLANQGIVVVGGAKVESGNGHVVAVYPGEKIMNGGYQYWYKKGEKYLTLKGTKLLPRCLSTSMGSWPGAKSKGDKTVWDPWGNDDKFNAVKFYTPRTETAASPT